MLENYKRSITKHPLHTANAVCKWEVTKNNLASGGDLTTNKYPCRIFLVKNPMSKHIEAPTGKNLTDGWVSNQLNQIISYELVEEMI